MATRSSLLAATILALSYSASATASYSLVKSYQGSSFFDDWTFYGSFDNLTNGDAIFVNSSVATSSQLAYVNSAGNAIIKVDNTSTVLYNDKRNTVRIASKDRFNVGSVWVTDMLHVPYGCSVWPAWWSQAPGWPWDYTPILIWFFPRASIPSSVSSSASTIDTSTLGTPVGNWPAGGCTVDTYFAAQNLIFDITLCGDFAGSASVFASTCSGTCYTDYVVGTGANYATAYFEVQYVRIYGTSSAVVVSSSSSKSGAMAAVRSGSWTQMGLSAALVILATAY
ncbi:hypothetical protein FRB94_014561 [Tulasnella sp. JGI-2019a]|nr:hypothetical protein FRB94_014561 [Tulasnella sp. JGI-2019a]